MRSTLSTRVSAALIGLIAAGICSSQTAAHAETLSQRAARAAAAHQSGATYAYGTATTPAVRQKALKIATQQSGKPYVYGAAGPSSFDCSGLVSYAFAKVGRTLPHNALNQYQVTHHIAMSQLQPGDLVFMNFSGGAPSGITHVGIYAGHGNWIVARKAGTPVGLQHIWTSQGVYASRP